MGKPIEITLTAEQGNWLFQRIAGFELPDKLGETKYDAITRSVVKDECRSAVRALKKHSYYATLFGDANRLAFGDKDQWVEGGSGEYKLVDAGREYKVNLDSDAVSGVMWMCFAILFPTVRSDDGKTVLHSSVSPIVADFYIWPIVEQLHKTQALRNALGLNTVKGKTRWDDDLEPKSE